MKTVRWIVILALATAAPALAGTGDGHNYLPAASFRATASNGCTDGNTSTAPVKPLKVCAYHATNRNGIWAEFWAPTSNTGNSFNAVCVMRVNSTNTAKNVGCRCAHEVTIDGGDWDANDGLAATFSSVGTAAVLGTANRDIPVTTGSFTSYNQVGAANCSGTTCKGKHGILVCQIGNDADVTNNLPTTDREIEGVHVYWDTP